MTHDLLQIALQLDQAWTVQEKELFADLTEYAVAARSDPGWVEHAASAGITVAWIASVDAILSSIQS